MPQQRFLNLLCQRMSKPRAPAAASEPAEAAELPAGRVA
jgi:hypothetical protein